MIPVRNGNVPASTPALDQPIPLSRLETTTATPKLPVRIAVASSRARREIIGGSGQAKYNGRLWRTCSPTLGVVPAKAGTHNPRKAFDDLTLNPRRYNDQPSSRDHAVWVPAFAGTTVEFEACATSLNQPALLARDLLDVIEVLLDELVELGAGQEGVDLGGFLD